MSRISSVWAPRPSWRASRSSSILARALPLHPLQQRFHAVPAHQPFQHVGAGRAQHVGEDPTDARSTLVQQAVQVRVLLIPCTSSTLHYCLPTDFNRPRKRDRSTQWVVNADRLGQCVACAADPADATCHQHRPADPTSGEGLHSPVNRGIVAPGPEAQHPIHRAPRPVCGNRAMARHEQLATRPLVNSVPPLAPRPLTMARRQYNQGACGCSRAKGPSTPRLGNVGSPAVGPLGAP